MQINLTPEQSAIMRHAVQTGRVHDPEEAMNEAMAQWLRREQQRGEFMKTLDDAEASLARGEGITIATEADRQQLLADISRRGRARLAAEQQAKS